jgi:uncharacterized protein (DUF433 family)
MTHHPEARAADRRQTMTDAQVLEARALVELAGWTTTEVIARYPAVKRSTVSGILEYLTRGRLIPKAIHLPAGVAAL